MGTSSLRSLLLAAIVLSNCITWTASRHHYVYNVNGHRIRHRRQGAGLFLPASYVIPGGEGNGAWGEWGEVSPCSRTCGGGVASQKRICLEFGLDGKPHCTGGDTKYFSCQTQDCPEGAGDFRAEQCAEYNDNIFRDQKIYSWVPYTKGHNPCELNCMPRGERFYYRQREKVIDGTRCNDESFDVCVNGTCQAVGCDKMLGSNAREDKCRECRGNGTNCRTMQDIINDSELRRGYNDVLLIPQGATNIFIEEIRASSNYLALRAKEHTRYYLNGDYHIDFPRSLVIAGALWHYERSQQGFAAPDKLRCIGPINEPLYLSLLLQEDNVGVKYEYSIPSDLAPRPTLQYGWTFEKFSPCSTACGGGFQKRTVTCRSREELEPVDESLCEVGLKPATNQTCNTHACPPNWVKGPWSPCSKPCGEGGTRTREVYCEKIITNRFPSVVSDKECSDQVGDKPNTDEKCNQNATCPTWFTGPWKPCDQLCDQGKQTRQVVCHTRINGRVEVFEDNECPDEKPPSEQACNLHPCIGIDYVLTEWSGCDTCLSTTRTRMAKCVTTKRVVVAYELCSYHPAPVLEEPCDTSKLPACEVQWYATQWSNCSVECGEGVQTRRVFCGSFDGKSVEEVSESKCDPQLKYRTTKPCEVPKEKCPAKWFTGPWSECSKKCGGGQQSRNAMCLFEDREIGICNGDTPTLLQSCNMGPCNEDQVWPVDSKSTPIMDDFYYYEDCDDEPRQEVGAESLDSPLFNGANYDLLESSGDYEPSSVGTSDWGSESTLTTDFVITDGSGFGSTVTFLESIDTESTETTGTYTSDTTEISSITSTFSESSTELSSYPASTESTNSELTTEIDSTTTNMTLTTDLSPTTSGTGQTDSTDLSSTDITELIEITTAESAQTESSETYSTSIFDTDSTISTDGISTESIITDSTDGTESTETGSTIDVTESTETGSTTVITESTETDSTTVVTESTETDSTTVVTESTETGSTIDVTESTETGSVTDVTESTKTGSTIDVTESTETGSTADVTESTETGSTTDVTESTETSSTEPTLASSSSPTDIYSTSTIETISTSSTEITEISTAETTNIKSESTDETDLTDKSTVSSTEDKSTTESRTTESGSTQVSEVDTTETGISTEYTTVREQESSTEFTTEAEALTTVTEISSTEMSSVGTTESISKSTEESTSSETVSELTGEVSTISSTQTSETTEFSSTTPAGSTEYTDSSSEGETDTTFTGLTSTEIPTEQGITPGFSSSVDWTRTTKQTYIGCRPKKIAKCLRSKYGCCPDKRTPATGTFDKGCPNLNKTCASTTFGCCSDGVSPANGRNNEGCPVINCNETLYGCCLSDKVTPAEGNDQEGCPKPVPACETSKYGCCADGNTTAKGMEKQGCPETEKAETETQTPETTTTIEQTTAIQPQVPSCFNTKFGCCADNATEATASDGAGCPCNITEFGCCPDGASKAGGPNMEGCILSCNTSVYGCCPDGQTPAHGPENEGCCLQTAYGCCPDNYKPADGPHLEGCGCQYAHYGCCPDNKTIARGASNEGCGCQYTQFGCCPDRHTEAQGPDFMGCDCSTYQFGCCPDGHTVVTGPNLEGCQCQQSDYGCCGDGQTAAKGPNQLGCDCSNSKYGCCPDGVTEAKGEKFLNCTDVPENMQAVCSMTSDRGPCRDFSVSWFYNVTYGGCTRFWYGGCEGNGNRFNSEADCEDVCVHPASKDVCKLPSVKGSCRDQQVRWFYDSTREQCAQFIYSGCLGNENNFETRELCQKRCEPVRTDDQCTLPIERGSCAGNYARWGYDAELRRCEQFNWGGCEGNANRFSSEAACLHRCNAPGLPKPECSLPQEKGNCTDKLALWAFRATENRCVPFYYSGCGGNRNRFESEASCALTCPSAYDKDICVLPAVSGNCASYTLKWYFDANVKRCRQFYYGGCGGNENNFMTEDQCESSCAEKSRVTPVPAPEPTPEPAPVQQPSPQAPSPVENNYCFLKTDPGPCDRYETRWAYEATRGDCVPFEYGGCGGNVNNFENKETCRSYCVQIQDVCQLPVLQGPCTDWSVHWYYDARTDSCQEFQYGGCEGNDNRFDSQQACEQRCQRQERPAPTTVAAVATTILNTTTTPPDDIPSNCVVSPTLEECMEAGQVWYLDAKQRACVAYTNAPTGSSCRHRGTYISQEACERACGAFRDLEVCRYAVDAGPCQAIVPKVYFDEALGICKSFVYGGCLGGPNRFSSMGECEEVCKPISDPCKQPPESGNCVGYYVMWYYDEERDMCGQFVFTGCSGNDNRFETEADCESRCKRPGINVIVTRPTTAAPVATTALDTTTHRLPTEREECSTPTSLDPCGRNITTYYYDTKAGACVRGDFGACNYANSYRSEEECERRCGAFRNIDVCRAVLDPGPCIFSVEKVYWDAASGRCLPFAFGGCLGGPNRFSTIQECEEVCGGTGPEAACLQPVKTGRGGCGVAARRWWYDSGAADCRAFAFRGCDGNDNNFASYAECAARCRIVDADNKVLPHCQRFDEHCDNLRCEGEVERTRGADGCVHCVCSHTTVRPIQPTTPSSIHPDCEPARLECEALKCTLYIQKTLGPDGCETCQCVEQDLCDGTVCSVGERCVHEPYIDPINEQSSYLPECRPVNKSGLCPEMAANESVCTRECSDDADCRGVGKCCTRGCQAACLPPLPATRPTVPLPTTTYVPDVPRAPHVNVETQPEVSAAEGGKATLRCLFHGNPPPSITWRRGEITIESDRERYRLLSDGALEIVSIYRNDSGVYICVGSNQLGNATQEVRLIVSDPEESSAGIAGEVGAVARGVLGRSLNVRCLAYGYPMPTIYWYHGRNGPMVPYSSDLYEARGNILQIRSLIPEALGEYICMAYNGIGKPAEWSVMVQIDQPEGTLRSTEATTTEPSTFIMHTPQVDNRFNLYTAPVTTSIITDRTTVPAGSEVNIRCVVEGYPLPDVYWTKDSVRVVPTDRISPTQARLFISNANTNDSGEYGCHARNAYSSHSATVQISVQGLYIPAKCTDNPYFARCELIVRSKFCNHQYYSRFCCKSCVEAGQLSPQEVEMQADEAWKK